MTVAVLKELSADERARMLYESREMARRDIAALNKRERQEGRQEGMQKGMQKGMQEGAIQIAISLLATTDLTTAQIAHSTQLTIEEVENLLKGIDT